MPPVRMEMMLKETAKLENAAHASPQLLGVTQAVQLLGVQVDRAGRGRVRRHHRKIIQPRAAYNGKCPSLWWT